MSTYFVFTAAILTMSMLMVMMMAIMMGMATITRAWAVAGESA